MKNLESIRIAVVDDHTLFRKGLISLLSDMEGFEIAAEASSGEEAASIIPRSQVDLVLLDINMPGDSGIRTLERLKKHSPGIRAIMLTISRDDKDLIDAIVAGADGYLLKNTEPAVLRQTILDVMQGNSALSPEVTAKVLQTVRESQMDLNKGLLSDREIEVVACLAKGSTTAEIASELFISINTVKTHVRHILEKLDVKNRAEAVAKAVQLDLLK